LIEIWSNNIDYYRNILPGYAFYYDHPLLSNIDGVGLGLTENDGHENDRPSKLQDMKLQNMKKTDQIAGHENAGHEIAGPSDRT